MGFYDPLTVQYVCDVFKSKWIQGQDKGKKRQKSEMFQTYSEFIHTSPIIIQIFDKLCYINNTQLDNDGSDV